MVLGAVISLWLFRGKRMDLYYEKGKVSTAVFLRILANGSSEFFSNISMSIMSVVYNFFLLAYGGTTGLAAFSVVMYVDSFDRLQGILQAAVVSATVTSANHRRLGIDEALALKAIYIFLDGVIAHADGFTNRGVARMTLKGFPVLAVHEECKESDLAVVKSETEHSLRHRKEIAGVISAFRIVISQGSISFVKF
jgi:hypothetical protein